MTRTDLTITACVSRNCRSGDTSGGGGIVSTLTNTARSGGMSSCSAPAESTLAMAARRL